MGMVPLVAKQLLGSEKAVAAGLLVVGVTVLCALGRITPQEWMDYTKFVLGIYVAGKTVTAAAEHMSKRGVKAPSPKE
jgi:hypothetical protein